MIPMLLLALGQTMGPIGLAALGLILGGALVWRRSR